MLARTMTRTMKQSREVFIRFGYLGLVFFTIKGMLWMTLPIIFTWYLN